MALAQLHGVIARVRLPGQQRWHPPGYLPMRHSWQALMLNAHRWKLPPGFLRRDINTAIADKLTGSLRSGRIRIAGLHIQASRGRFWWAPVEAWDGTARVVVRKQNAVLVALMGRSLMFPMPDGSERPFIPFIAEHDLATAMGAESPPDIDKSGEHLIHDLVFWPNGRPRDAGVRRPNHRPTSRDEFQAESVRRAKRNEISRTLDLEAAYLYEWQKLPSQKEAGVRPVAVRTIKSYLRLAFNQDRWPEQWPESRSPSD